MKANKIAMLSLLLLLILFCGNSRASDQTTVTDTGFIRGIYVGMNAKNLIELVGAPEQVKSEGKCFAYPSLGVSIMLDTAMTIDKIYLGPSFSGIVSLKNGKTIELNNVNQSYIFESVDFNLVTYSPSPFIQNRATVELEMEMDNKQLPLEYRGGNRLYKLYGHGIVMKYKYVLDKEGIAFYFDENKNLYSAVIYRVGPDERDVKPITQICKSSEQYPKRLKPIHFEFGRHDIRPEDIRTLDDHVAALKENAELLMIVEGHTDYIGGDRYNLELSKKRAETSAGYLVQKGVSPERIGQVWYGKSRPVATNETEEGRALNRRAEFIVYPK